MKLFFAVVVVLVAGACGGGGNHEMLDPERQYGLEVQVVGENGGLGDVAVDGRKSCATGETCTYAFNIPTLGELPPARLTAVPAFPTGSNEFVGWSGDCTGSAPMIEVSAPAGTELACTATFRKATGPSMSSFTTLIKPEGVDVFHIGSGRPMGVGMPLLVAPGLADGTYVAVAGGDTMGGLDLINLATGARKTNMFVDISPAYGVTAYQGPSSPLWVVFGAQGTATTGWNNTAMDFGGTGLGAAANTTQVATADFNDDGATEKLMVVAPNGTISVYAPDGTGGVLISATAFAGTAGQPVSAQFGRTIDEVLIVLVDGRVFFGPAAGAAGRLTLVGNAGTSPRLMQCAGTTPRVCAIADYTGDMVHVVEIDAAGARIVASRAVGDAPIDPAVLMNLGRGRIVVTGSGDNTVEVLSYDPTAEALTVDVARQPVAGCIAPNHVRWLSATEALIPCYGGNTVVRMPL